MGKIKIKPKEGFRVKKPNGDFLKKEGEIVEKGVYWGRRIKFGEVEICDDSKPEIKKAEPKEEPKKKKQKKSKKKKENKAIEPTMDKEGE